MSRNFHQLTQTVLTIPKLKRPARSCASLTAEPVCLHLPAYADFESQKAPTNCRRFSFAYRCAFSEPAVPRQNGTVFGFTTIPAEKVLPSLRLFLTGYARRVPGDGTFLSPVR